MSLCCFLCVNRVFVLLLESHHLPVIQCITVTNLAGVFISLLSVKVLVKPWVKPCESGKNATKETMLLAIGIHKSVLRPEMPEVCPQWQPAV